ncbi:MAG: flagellar basal body rod protein FlgB [Tuberibacillus sp.]
MMDLFGNTTIPILEKALDRTSMAHSVIAQNIANADTPNYKAQRLVFSDELQSAIQAQRTDPRHFGFKGVANGARIVTDRTSSIQNNGNNVDVDTEMVNLAKNQIAYQAYSEAISRKFNEWKIVLQGGQ